MRSSRRIKKGSWLDDIVNGLVIGIVVVTIGFVLLDALYFQAFHSHLLLEIAVDLFIWG